MKKANIDTSKPKKRKTSTGRAGHKKGSLAELREAVRKAHERLVGAEPFMDRTWKTRK